MRKFLRNVIWSSEKAASIARACRKEDDLFQLLVEEKKGDDKNPKYSHDFKTLADVLIQETVRHDLGKKYPGLKDDIFGEESNKFTNTLGESVQVQVCDTQDDTSKLLSKVLDGRKGAADILAKLVHSDINPGSDVEESLNKVPDDEEEDINVDDFGIWIDPIDGTNNYIKGQDERDAENLKNTDIVPRGLPVVTVLIGIFSKKTGAPILGVVNQPFAFYDPANKKWSGRIHWGCVHKNEHLNNIVMKPCNSSSRTETPKIILSMVESKQLIETLKPHFDLVEAGGAGHKILCVVLGLADIYVTSKPSTFKWDTCAGQGILNSMGGGAVEFLNPTKNLIYNQPNVDEQNSTKKFGANDQGLIAFRQQSDLEKLLKVIHQ